MTRTTLAWTKRGSCVVALLCLLGASASFAQAPGASFPVRPLRIIVPYPPGGLGDIFPRALGLAAGETFGQQIIVENRPGATQIIGAQVAAKATPDGYTLFFGSVTSLAINPASRPKLPYDPLRDFAPVTFCFSTPLYLVVHSAVPAKSVKELIALVRAQPGKLPLPRAVRAHRNIWRGNCSSRWLNWTWCMCRTKARRLPWWTCRRAR